MAFTKILMENETLAAGEEKRLLPGIDVQNWDRLHFHIGAKARSIAGISVRILFATSVEGGALLADSTVWFEQSVWEREFSHQVPGSYGGTGFVMSVPVIAPHLYDVILRNNSSSERKEVSVALMAQEI